MSFSRCELGTPGPNSLIASATTTSRNLTPASRGCKIACKRVLFFSRLSRLPHLLGVPHLHVNRPLRSKHTTTSYFKESYSNSFLSHPFKKIQTYACTEKQEGNLKLREIASNRPLLHTHFTHVGMLQSQYNQFKVELLLSTWIDYVRYFASSLFAISTN